MDSRKSSGVGYDHQEYILLKVYKKNFQALICTRTYNLTATLNQKCLEKLYPILFNPRDRVGEEIIGMIHYLGSENGH